MKFLKILLIVFSGLATVYGQNDSNLEKPLAVEEVFQWSVERVNGSQVLLSVDIAEGYYLYKERFSLQSADVKLDYMPKGKVKRDPAFGDVVIYDGRNELAIELISPLTSLSFKFQGCQEGGVCYPPTKVNLAIPGASESKENLLGLGNNKTKASLGFINNNGLLSEDEAFPAQMSILDDGAVEFSWKLSDGYYLYVDKIKVKSQNAVVDVVKSEGDIYNDEFFGEQLIYRHANAQVKVYLNKFIGSEIIIQYQGCADVGVCYPVMEKTFPLSQGFIDNLSEGKVDGASNEESRISQALSGNIFIAIGLLLLAGIALAFTPCVLPMLPILLGMLHGQANLSRKRTIVLAGAYALGMATMTATFGVIVSLMGVNLQIIFQKWWLLAIFAMVFVAAGVSMLGVFDFSMPTAINTKVQQWQNRHTKEGPFSTFIVGALSVLVVGPCVAPPLFAVLTYASTTGDVVTSGLYLFTLGLGMGLPMVGFAVLSNNVPKTGAWSILVKQLMGWLLIAVALWLIGRLVSGQVSLILWGLWSLGVAHAVFKTDLPKIVKLKYLTVLIFTSVGLFWIVGGCIGGTNPLSPFKHNKEINYIYVEDTQSLQSYINKNDILLVDFYADWCISCKENEAFVFTDEAVFGRLSEITVIKVDMTDTTEAHRELLESYELVGPPALIIYKQGVQTELIVGKAEKEKLLSSLKL